MNRFTIHRMGTNEWVPQFDCGDTDLNDFILNSAPTFRNEMLAVTYVMQAASHPGKVVAFCSLANDCVSLADFDDTRTFNRFRKQRGFPQAKRFKSYPAVKICRLGVDLSVSGQGVGTRLLDFVKTHFSQDSKAGCRFVTVDAYHKAVPFYEKNGFLPLDARGKDTPYTRALYFDLAELS